MIVALNAPPTLNPDFMTLDYITYPSTRFDAPLPAPATVGHFREPLPARRTGRWLPSTRMWKALETRQGVGADYAFRLMSLAQAGSFWQPYQNLTSGISKNVNFYSNGGLVNYNGVLWELNPVEVRARPIPVSARASLPAPEQNVFAEERRPVPAFQNYLRTNSLALLVSRNLTTRDHADRQQPFNLHVAGTTTQTIGAPGKIYDIASLQFFQGDQIRGFGLRGTSTTPIGRAPRACRALARSGLGGCQSGQPRRPRRKRRRGPGWIDGSLCPRPARDDLAAHRSDRRARRA